jgi:hypothetical protein
MAYRMLRYLTQIWDTYQREHPDARRLPAVIPLVVHHGKRRWASPAQLLDLIDLGPAAKEAARAYLPRFEFLLDDLSGINDRQLQDRDLTPAAEITLVLLRDAPGQPPDRRRAAIAVREAARSAGPARWQRGVHRVHASLGPDAEEAYMTTAEMLRAEGEARRAANDILVVFEQRGIGIDDKSRQLIQSCTNLGTLNGWFRRAFKVDQASDLFEE